MKVGDLDKRIILQAQTKVADGLGNFTVTWTDIATVNAALWPVSAKDQINAAQNMGVVTHKIRIRYRRVLKSAWRVKFQNRYFAIVAPPINPNENNQYLDLICKEAA